ncbi:MAG: ISL3 family transposase [Paludibacter sp.]|nr:ISL3 family transposase [Paludibacter sp.]
MMETSTDFLERLLNFGDGWKIEDVEIRKSKKELYLHICYTKPTAICPHTNEDSKIYDYGQERTIRHLDLFEYKTYLRFRLPRVINSVKVISSIKTSFADERVSYTYLLENRVIEILQATSNQSKTSELMDLSFDIVHGIMQRAVSRGLKRRSLDGINEVCIDEKSYGQGHQYFSILSDLNSDRLLEINDERTTDSANELIQKTFTEEQRTKIGFIAMDMWKPFMQAAKESIPKAKIIHDKFHITKYLNKGVDTVRKQESKIDNHILKNTKYIFLKDKSRWTYAQSCTFEQINQINLTTSKAWHIKENFKELFNQMNINQCIKFFKEWYTNTLESDIKPMISVADTILKHIDGVINAALYQLTNARAESINAKIQIVKSTARGFKNFIGYRTSLMFFLGRLDMLSY